MATLIGETWIHRHLLCEDLIIVNGYSREDVVANDAQPNHQDGREDDFAAGTHRSSSPIDEIFASQSSEMAQTIFSHLYLLLTCIGNANSF